MDEFVNNLLASPEFAQLILTIFTVTLTGVVAFVGKELKSFLHKKLSAEQLAILMKVAEQAVFVAEQTGIDHAAEEKKMEALRVAEAYLKAYGIKVTAEQLDAAIEAAVFSQLNQFKVEEEVIEAAVEDEPEAPAIAA